MENSASAVITWLDPARVPEGQWPFLSVARNSLRELRETHLLQEVDITEGLGGITTTGRMEVYRQLVLRRVIDLAQAVALTWNAGLTLGAVVAARGLLETLAVFHEFMNRADALAADKAWDELSGLADTYALSSSNRGTDATRPSPPRIGPQVTRFIKATQPGAEVFWHQISDASHPNGLPMLRHYGTFKNNTFIARTDGNGDAAVFPAVYNCLYSICWLLMTMEGYDRLLDRIRYVDPEL